MRTRTKLILAVSLMVMAVFSVMKGAKADDVDWKFVISASSHDNGVQDTAFFIDPASVKYNPKNNITAVLVKEDVLVPNEGMMTYAINAMFFDCQKNLYQLGKFVPTQDGTKLNVVMGPIRPIHEKSVGWYLEREICGERT